MTLAQLYDEGPLPGQDVEIFDDILTMPVDFNTEDELPVKDRGDSGSEYPKEGPLFTSESGVDVYSASMLLKLKRVVPHRRDLKVGKTGGDVVALKRALVRSKQRHLKDVTPAFGAILKKNVQNFQHVHGLETDGIYGTATHNKLKPFYDDYGVWLILHTKIIQPISVRDKIINAAIFGYNHRGSIHYTQGNSRMYGVRNRIIPPRIPLYEDCSSFATWCYGVGTNWKYDPNHFDFNGLGYTGTFATHGVHTYIPRKADVALYGAYFPYHHITVYIGNNRCISHGSEIGPLLLPVRYRGDFNQYRSYPV